MSVLSCKTTNCPNYNFYESINNGDNVNNDNGNSNNHFGGWRYSFSSSSNMNNRNTELCVACKKSKKLERQKKTRSQVLISKGLMNKSTSILTNTAVNNGVGVGRIGEEINDKDGDDKGFGSYQDFVKKFENTSIGGMYRNKRGGTVPTNNNNKNNNKRISIAEFDGRIYMINNNNVVENGNNDSDDDSENNVEFEKHSYYCECGGSGIGCQCSTKCFC